MHTSSCDSFDINVFGGLGDGDHIMNASFPSLLVLDGDQQPMPVDIEDLPALLRAGLISISSSTSSAMMTS